uniref:hypothetical protein n=1 Tax=Gemmiger formicilis TaxID=745368 RepID=UPI0040277ACA
SIQDVFRCSVGWQSITLTANTIITNTSRGFAPFCAGNFEFFAKFIGWGRTVGAGHARPAAHRKLRAYGKAEGRACPAPTALTNLLFNIFPKGGMIYLTQNFLTKRSDPF